MNIVCRHAKLRCFFSAKVKCLTVNGGWLVEWQPSVEMVVLGAAAERVEEVVGS